MFDKHLNVDMLEYTKLYEESESEGQGQELSALSSIKEERESKEEHNNSKKVLNQYSAINKTTSENKQPDVNTSESPKKSKDIEKKVSYEMNSNDYEIHGDDESVSSEQNLVYLGMIIK